MHKCKCRISLDKCWLRPQWHLLQFMTRYRLLFTSKLHKVKDDIPYFVFETRIVLYLFLRSFTQHCSHTVDRWAIQTHPKAVNNINQIKWPELTVVTLNGVILPRTIKNTDLSKVAGKAILKGRRVQHCLFSVMLSNSR